MSSEKKEYQEAAIVFSACSVYYLIIFLWKGITVEYGTIFYVVIGLLIFFITVVPYFVYKGSRGWALTFVWIYTIRALGSSWHIYSGTEHGIEWYTLPSLFVCVFILFRATWIEKQNKSKEL